jgi:hypothetical protein
MIQPTEISVSTLIGKKSTAFQPAFGGEGAYMSADGFEEALPLFGPALAVEFNPPISESA